MRLKQGDKERPIITGKDVINIKSTEEQNKIVTVDDVLDEHKKEIDKLKSNVKYIYSYGGVGGNGHGGSSGGGTGSPMLFVSLGGHQIQSGSDNIIVFSKPGEYVFEGSLSNANGEIFYVYVGYGKNIKNPKQFTLDKDNRWIIKSESYNLKENGQIVITLKDVEGRTLSTITQTYVVEAHSFDVKFKYFFEDMKVEFDPYEYFMGNSNQRNPFIDISFSINIPNVQNVKISYNINGVDGQSDVQYSDSMDDITTGKGSILYGQITNNNLKIYLENLQRNGIPFINENNTGTYDVTVTLNYSVSGSPADPTVISFKITLIPNYLYINVRNSHNVLFDNLKDLTEELSKLVEGQDFEKAIPVGTNTSFYCKVYEQAMSDRKMTYDITFYSYNEDKTSEDGFDVNPQYTDQRTAEEQVETPRPINVAFDSPGIKKLKFMTIGKKTTSTCTIIKYIYVKENKNQIDWYPTIEQQSSYFRANQGVDTYKDFPELPVVNNGPIEMSETSNPLTISHPTWSQNSNGYDTTILSFGIQYGAVNNDGAEVIKIYKNNDAIVNLCSDTLFSTTSKKILLPLEKDLDPADSSKYHLVQIVSYWVGSDINAGGRLYARYLYIDGKLESDDPASPYRNPLFIDKIVLNNVNAIYNLINVQYLRLGTPSTVKGSLINNTIDGLIYQYYLAYKSRMNAGEVTDAERTLLTNISDIKFDGTNVVVDYNFLTTIAHHMPIPTMMMSFGCKDDNDGISISDAEAAAFYEKLFRGYESGNTEAFGDEEIALYWCDGLKDNTPSGIISRIVVPTQYDEERVAYDGNWHVKLQGTSTMKNRIKNFSLYIQKRDEDLPKSILVSPNYDSTNPRTFLPENEWTLKADIADSAHANNTAVGKFVNENCTKFSNNLPLPDNIRPYIKNTLEGFPVLMYFRIKDDIYYLGVYNFNMGRQSFYNLGYHASEDMTDMINYIPEHSLSSFVFSLGSGKPVNNLVIAEIQENWADFDFHQYGDDVLFQDDGNPRTMFGIPKDKMTYTNIDNAKSTLREFVKSVGRAGAYCFANIGKIPVSSEGENGDCENKYNAIEDGDIIREYVPDLSYQFYYNQDGKRVYLPQIEDNKFDRIKVDIDNLLKCIWNRDKDNREIKNRLNFTSVSEYYTICMAFGLIDSILKNMNIKSWDGTTCFTAFYDMDCAFGEDNIGRENVSYLAATDYWYSPISEGGYIEPLKKKFDYWPTQQLKGFDFTSSYLFAIAKYAQSIFAVERPDITLTNYPQQFWVNLRNNQLRNADDFMKNYFSSGIGIIPSYLASLNYQVKYLYYGTKIDESTGEETENRYLANESAFNGSRFEKVRDWLNRRLHFLDFMFNVQGIDINIGSTDYKIPIAKIGREDLSHNSDVVILKDAFSSDQKNGAIIGSDGDYIGIEAPLNTPIVINRGKGYNMFLLTAGTGAQNNVKITATQSETFRILGSTEFTNMTRVEPVLTEAYKIETDNLKEIKYGGRAIQPDTITLKITSSSVKKIILPIPTLSGQLIIDTGTRYGQALHTLDINNSGFYGTWTGLKNLKNLNISSVNGADITISECPLVGENCVISGTVDKPTTLSSLTLSGVKGKFKLENTKIKAIDISALQNEDAEFEIDGDTELTTLTLTRFKSVIIKGCPKLNRLMILDPDDNKVCETISIDIPDYHSVDGSEIPGLEKFNSTEDVHGVFDFTQYDNLKYLNLTGCKNVIVIKIPNHKVSVGKFSENRNLEFIDTIGEYSRIELTTDSTFFKSPCYSMKQSWTVNGSQTFDGENIYNIPKTDGGKGYKCIKRTKMSISSECTTLANTFYKQSSGERSNYPDKNHSYTNEWGQEVFNPEMTILDAAWFINTVVEGKPLDDAYLKADGTIVDKQSGGEQIFGDDCSDNITSLHGCFAQRDGISFKGNLDYTVPILTNYTSLNDIGSMYLNTDIDYISSTLLSLYDGNNDNKPEHRLLWQDFVRTDKIYSNAFEHISYRIEGLDTAYTVYGVGDKNTPLNSGEEEFDEYGETIRFDVVDLLSPKKDELGNWIPFNRIVSFNNFSINGEQWVDYSHLFEFCPRVKQLVGFLSGVDLSKAKLDGMLKTCKELENVSNSFNHSGNVEDLKPINLYDFFNWAEIDSEDNLFNINALFSTESTNQDIVRNPGFAINKRISQAELAKIIGTLHKYKNITKLSNIFSYCTIEDYDPNYEIVLSGDMNVTNLNSLFYKCKSGNGYPLKIRRSFFEHLPNVTNLVNTFYGVEFDHMFSYDFFCKRKEQIENVYVKIDGNIPSTPNAKLYTYTYTRNQSDLSFCFANAKFKNCKTWFDLKDGNELLKQRKDVVKDINGNEFGFTVNTYYKYEGGRYVEYNITEPNSYTDTLNNFTNYVDSIMITAGTTVINNHNIFGEGGDFSKYGTSGFGKPYVENTFNVYPTYCCLPPDILYACDYSCELEGVFANTNIIGTLPQHLLGNRYNSNLKNIFQNVNILPNVIYHYDSRQAGNTNYLNILNGQLGEYSYLISDGGIPIDNDTINPQSAIDEDKVYPIIGSSDDDAIVLFRNEKGELRRRYPTDNENMSSTARINGDYNKSQFVYVPQGFTTNRFLEKTFTFRYNLPQQINLSESDIYQETGVRWRAGVYDETYNPENYPELWPYYTQYFFTTDESVSWEDVSTMSGAFISDDQDVDFNTGETRLLSTSNPDLKNKWWLTNEDVNTIIWDTKTTEGYTSSGNKGGIFNSFLNLCGMRDTRTGIFKDCGCLINRSIDKRNTPVLSNFVSGILVVFLNGRVFNEGVDGIRLTKQNGSNIINYNVGFGRNIILPRLGTIPYSDVAQVPRVLLTFPSSSQNAIFYEFMFPRDGETLNRYKLVYNINPSIIDTSSKYKVL